MHSHVPTDPLADVVVVGGGHAGVEACTALRKLGHWGRLTLVCDEGTAPYQRPPLSKEHLRGAPTTPLRADAFYERECIELVHDPAAWIDRAGRTLVLAGGRRLPYGRLVLATGARPRPLPVPGADAEGVLALRTVADAAALHARLGAARDVVVVGGGFVGLEVAAAAPSTCRVSVVESLPRIMARAVSPVLSAHLTAVHRRRAVRIALGRSVRAVRADSAGRACGVVLDDGTHIAADLVLVGIGAVPNTQLAAGAGLRIDNGIAVDSHLRTSDPAVLAIGDCASYPEPRLGRRVRLESVQNATDQGRHVAATIAGTPGPYAAAPWFWSDQGDVRLQLAGFHEGYDQLVTLGDPGTGAFSVCAFRNERLIAVESVNRPLDHMAARRLLATGPARVTPADVSRPGLVLKDVLRQPV